MALGFHAVGHHVLVVPVPALEPWAFARTRHYDPSFLSADPGFVHAHITLLSPWLAAPAPVDLERVEKIAAAASPFSFSLSSVDVFPGGTIHSPPVPAAPFAELTSALYAAFPMCPPYGGEFEPVPHLTLDHVLGGVTVASVGSALGSLLPVTCVADRIDLQWYDNDSCHLVDSWGLGRIRGAA